MKVLGIIPSRYESSRYPGKPLIDINGKTMIERVYTQASKSKLIDKIIVATDDDRIYKHVLSFGGNAMMTSTNHSSGTSRCGEVIETDPYYDIIINIQGDEPLIDPSQLDGVIRLFKDDTVEIATIVKQINDITDVNNPNRIKVVLDKNKNGIYFSRSPIPFVANTPQNEWLKKANFWKHIGIYAWRINTLKTILKLPKTNLEQQESLEQLNWLYNGYKIATVETKFETPNIDVPEDLEKVINLLNNY